MPLNCLHRDCSRVHSSFRANKVLRTNENLQHTVCVCVCWAPARGIGFLEMPTVLTACMYFQMMLFSLDPAANLLIPNSHIPVWTVGNDMFSVFAQIRHTAKMRNFSSFVIDFCWFDCFLTSFGPKTSFINWFWKGMCVWNGRSLELSLKRLRAIATV